MTINPNDFDVILAQISRKNCKALDFQHLDDVMKIVLSKGKAGYKSLVLAFDGWETDPGEIYEISAIRKYIAEMVKKYPHIYYHLTDEQNLDMLYLAALGDLSTFAKEGSNDKAVYDIKISSEDYSRILNGTMSYGLQVDDMENAVATLRRIDEVLGY